MTDPLQKSTPVAPEQRTPPPHVRPRLTPQQRFVQHARRSPGLLLLFLWFAVALSEVLLHCNAIKNQGNLLSSGLLLGPLFALVPAMMICLLCGLIPSRRINFGLCILYSLLSYILHASQLVYYKVFGTFYSFQSMTRGAQVIQFMSIILDTIRQNLPVLIGMAVPLLILLIFGWKCFSFRPKATWKSRLVLAVLCAAVQLGLVASLPLFGGTDDTSPYGLYHNNADSYLSGNKLGMLTAFRLDFQRWVTGDAPSGSIVLDVPTETTAAPTTLPPETQPTETVPTETTEPPIDTSPNVLDIDFDTLIAQETDSAVQEVHRYFASRTPSSKNEKTGLFEGSNLILITAEAFSCLAVDETRTPTLYKLMTEGYQFTNYYVPDWGTSTTDGEYAFLTGTIPKAGVWSFSKSSDNFMPLTMCQQLLNQGYSAYAYHGHTYTYYDRNEYLGNLGYQYKGYGNGLDVKWQWPESDVEVVDLSTKDYVNSAPFTTYYMTISGHREYNFYGNMMSFKNKDRVSDEPYSDNVRAYLACQLELEDSLTLLLQRLEEAGQLENTVIVLTADHYPNGLTNSEIGELLGHEPETNFEIYKNGCIIWKAGLESEIIDEPVSHLDLLPTLSNLFGLDFDSRLYMGRDVFSDAEPFVCFRNRSWITAQAMYNADTGEVTSLTDEPLSDEYIEAMNTEVNNRFAVSARILEYDYWNILF